MCLILLCSRASGVSTIAPDPIARTASSLLTRTLMHHGLEPTSVHFVSILSMTQNLLVSNNSADDTGRACHVAVCFFLLPAADPRSQLATLWATTQESSRPHSTAIYRYA